MLTSLILSAALVQPDYGPWRKMKVTAYAPGCGATQATASGVWPEENWSVATGSEYPFGTVIQLSYRGILTTRIVHDRFRYDIPGRVDLYVKNCEMADRWGIKYVDVRVVRKPLGKTGETK